VVPIPLAGYEETFYTKAHLINGKCLPIGLAEGTVNKTVKTDFLFAQPSMASGAARVFDLWGQFNDYNRSDSASEADAKAIAADWLVVGQDIYSAIEQHESELNLA